MLNLNVSKLLYKSENEGELNNEYRYMFSETNELVLLFKTYLPVIKKHKFLNLKGRTLENQKTLLIPNFLIPPLFKAIYEMKLQIDKMSKEEFESKKDEKLVVDFKKIKEGYRKAFDEVCETPEGALVKQMTIDKFKDSFNFDRHPLDNTLKQYGFTKMYSDRNYRIKKEYSLLIGLDYSISLAYIRYMPIKEKNVIVSYDTYSLPYEALLNLLNLENFKEGEN